MAKENREKLIYKCSWCGIKYSLRVRRKADGQLDIKYKQSPCPHCGNFNETLSFKEVKR